MTPLILTSVIWLFWRSTAFQTPSWHNHALTSLTRRARAPGSRQCLKALSDSWDDDVDYDKLWSAKEDVLPTSDWDSSSGHGSESKGTDLQVPKAVSELIDSQTAQEIKEESRKIIEEKAKQGRDQISKLRKELSDDFESQKRAMERRSDARSEVESKRLLGKIDAITEQFLSETKQVRDSTKLAAAADRAMEGKGLDLGSWGALGDAVVPTTGSVGLLGSVGSAKQRQTFYKSETEGAVFAGKKGRILIVADEGSDPVAKQLVPKFTAYIQDIMAVEVQIVKPTQQMPLGGNNAACVIFFLTSLASPPRAFLERLLRRTMLPDGTVGQPPTQLVAVSTLGTERTEKFPYSIQNLMGRNLDTRRDMEQALINAVKEREVEPPIDYTIVKFGELKDEAPEEFAFMPGDVLDGTTSVDTAARVLVQAVAFHPSARNATLCVIGKLPQNVESVMWDDAFLKLDGPELFRYESRVSPDLFIQLTEYVKEWGQLFAESGKLTTPVDYEASTKGPNAAFEGVSRRDGMKLLFQSTGTGVNYLSREEERELEKKGVRPAAPISRRVRPEGGVEVLVEITTKGNLRVRARRTAMGKDTVIKELSEETILSRLKETLDLFEKKYA